MLAHRLYWGPFEVDTHLLSNFEQLLISYCCVFHLEIPNQLFHISAKVATYQEVPSYQSNLVYMTMRVVYSVCSVSTVDLKK